jgi:hypothetical protein
MNKKKKKKMGDMKIRELKEDEHTGREEERNYEKAM